MERRGEKVEEGKGRDRPPPLHKFLDPPLKISTTSNVLCKQFVSAASSEMKTLLSSHHLTYLFRQRLCSRLYGAL